MKIEKVITFLEKLNILKSAKLPITYICMGIIYKIRRSIITVLSSKKKIIPKIKDKILVLFKNNISDLFFTNLFLNNKKNIVGNIVM